MTDVAAYHRGMQVRTGGASQAQVREMLKGVDADKNGEISEKELSALSKKGRDAGFADKDAKNLFHAGIDASALAQSKTAEPGQQLSGDYIDKNMKPALKKAYGTQGSEAADIVAPEASKELTKGAAARFDDSVKLDQFHKGEIKSQFGAGTVFRDMNKNGSIDAGDRMLVPDGNGGYRPRAIDATRAEDIKKNVSAAREKAGDEGMTKAAKAFEPPNGPNFPSHGDGSRVSDMANGNTKKWLGGKSHEDGGPWKRDKFGQDPWFPEYKLDTSRMKGSEALDQLIKDPKSSTMDCAMAKQVAQLQRVRGALGDEKFNKLVEKEGMSVGYGAAENQSGLLSKIGSRDSVGDPSKVGEYKSGQAGYAEVKVGDPKLQAALDKAGWAGEHFTIRKNEQGEKVVFAHPFGTIKDDKFDGDLRDKIVSTAKDAGYTIDKKDIKITYEQPRQYDLDKAAELARD